MRALIIAAVLAAACTALEFNTYDADYGVFLGELSNLADGEVQGKVFVVNETAIQLVNFTYNGNGPGKFFCFSNVNLGSFYFDCFSRI